MNETEYIRKDLHDKDINGLSDRLEDLKGRLDDYKTTTSDQTTRLGVLVGAISALFALRQIGLAVVLWILTHPVK